MTFYDIAHESWLSISGNKMRSFLTVLGIVIGIMAVVIMVAVGQTVRQSITAQFSSLGTNTIMIRAGAAQSAGVRSGNRMTLTMDDVTAIQKLPDVAAVSPVENSNAQIVYGNKNWSTSMVGVYPGYATVQNLEMEYGAFFDEGAVRTAATYAVIGPKTASELGMPENPVGEVIRIRNTPVVIVGVTRAKGDSAMGSQDDMVIVPITTLKKRITGSRFPNSVMTISMKLYQDADNNVVTEQVTALLRTRHKLKEGAEDDFQITDMKQVLETMDNVSSYLTLLLVAIAAVSLLVGSIGIMNMMLVSVAERTREIGVRKAIGAHRRHIVIQFLSESVLISLIGSLFGLILGVGLSQGIGRFVMGYDVPFSIWPVVVSMSVAIFVGLVSGVMPAIKASKLNPIDSLRYE